ncbi:MAG: hypothetical protein KAI90_08910, partial [Desulfobulbaceae bacterium]|nr:hypothetical protein [Desulfobulbaceae bacterium]
MGHQKPPDRKLLAMYAITGAASGVSQARLPARVQDCRRIVSSESIASSLDHAPQGHFLRAHISLGH